MQSPGSQIPQAEPSLGTALSLSNNVQDLNPGRGC